MTLLALTEQIQAAVEPYGWTAEVIREGDSLVVDLTGPVCPDPLVAMMAVEAELERSDRAGLEAVKLYGHCSVAAATGATASQEAETPALQPPGWMSVIDLDRYFSRRAGLLPEAFGLGGAAASRMACEAERDRYSATPAVTPAASSIASEAELVDETELQALALASTPEENKTSPEFEDPWEIALLEAEVAAVPLPLENFPRISQAEHSQAMETSEAVQVPVGFNAPPEPQTIAPELKPLKNQAATQGLAALTGYDRYREFITERSSWFAQTVKDNPRLHQLAKQRQHYTIGTLSHYLVNSLAESERLMDLVPVRKRDRGCGLIFTDQRVIALSQSGRRNHQDLEEWMVHWSCVYKVEICHDALQFHYGRARERFNVDLQAPYHLRNSIPRDIPIRMVREIHSSPKRALKTKTGLAMVAGVMFALGSGFSLMNNWMVHQQIEARPDALAASRNVIQADSSKELNGPKEQAPVASVAAPLVMTTSHEQCVDSFNRAAQPHAYATLNQVTHTLQVNLQNQVLLQMSSQQFDQTAAAVAQEILSSCQAKAINQVVVTNGAQRYKQVRPISGVTAVQTEGELKLF